MNALQEIRQQMEELIENGDAGSDHRHADALLINLIEYLAHIQNDEGKQQVKAILQAYRQIGKWYE